MLKSKLTKKRFDLFPKYVSLNGCALRLVRNDDENPYELRYYRDAGVWTVSVKENDGKLVSCSSVHTIDNVILIPITYKVWRKDNAGYLDKEDTAITWESYKSGGSAFGRPSLT